MFASIQLFIHPSEWQMPNVQSVRLGMQALRTGAGAKVLASAAAATKVSYVDSK